MNASTESTSEPRIVFTVDGDYVRPLCVALLSLWEAHRAEPCQPHIVVLHDNLGATARTVIEQLTRTLALKVDFLEAPSATSPKPVSEWWSSAMYLRIAIPEALSADHVALYLDADTLVLDSLRPLLATDVTDVCLAAVRDPLNPVLSHGNALPGWWELGLAGNTEYFNSGVMVMNLEKCRNEGLSERCWAFLDHNRDHARFFDQDALNFVTADRWLRLDRRWNTFPISAMLAALGEEYSAEEILPLSALLSDESAAAILHFAGPVKPWDETFPAGPARAVYKRFSDEARLLTARS